MSVGLVVAAMASVLVAAGPTVPKPAPSPAPSSPAPTSAAVREAFDRGRTAFGRAEYQRAIEILRPLLYPEELLESDSEIVQAHRMLGVAYLFENKPEEARREFEKLIRRRQDFRFDPLLDPQRVVDFFNEVLKENKALTDEMNRRRLERERAAAEERERAAARARMPPTIVRYERHSYVVNFVPFGAGQFQNGHRKKGWFFFGTEALLGAVSLGAFATNFTLYGLTPDRRCNIPTNGGECPPAQIDHSQENTSRTLTGVQVISGGVFFAVAIWGVIDAIINFQPEVPLADSAGKVARTPSSDLQFTFSPGGFGAAWRF